MEVYLLKIKQNENPLMHQEWRNLLFLHWKCDPKKIQATLPDGLFVDTFEGAAYITVLPFLIENFKVNCFSTPIYSRLVEINVRTYVVDKKGLSGIWFYSLDINSFFSMMGANIGFSLPYYFSRCKFEKFNDQIIVEGKRVFEPSVEMKFSYKVDNEKPDFFALEKTLDFFLVERYVLFTFKNKKLMYGRVRHKPYALQNIQDLKYSIQLKDPLFNPSNTPDCFHFASGVDSDIFPLHPLI